MHKDMVKHMYCEGCADFFGAIGRQTDRRFQFRKEKNSEPSDVAGAPDSSTVSAASAIMLRLAANGGLQKLGGAAFGGVAKRSLQTESECCVCDCSGLGRWSIVLDIQV